MSLFVICGPTASGKSTLVRMVVERQLGYTKVVACTTRPPRPGEKAGLDYNFVSESEFLSWTERNLFFEWKRGYNGTYYGVLKRDLAMTSESTRRFIIVDADGVGAYSRVPGYSGTIIITAPVPLLIARLQSGTALQQERVATVRAEGEAYRKMQADITIENIDLEAAYSRFVRFLDRRSAANPLET